MRLIIALGTLLLSLNVLAHDPCGCTQPPPPGSGPLLCDPMDKPVDHVFLVDVSRPFEGDITPTQKITALKTFLRGMLDEVTNFGLIRTQILTFGGTAQAVWPNQLCTDKVCFNMQVDSIVGLSDDEHNLDGPHYEDSSPTIRRAKELKEKGWAISIILFSPNPSPDVSLRKVATEPVNGVYYYNFQKTEKLILSVRGYIYRWLCDWVYPMAPTPLIPYFATPPPTVDMTKPRRKRNMPIH